jgi:hypothetical protein
MQGRIAGFFMTIFMALPLAAIPLMSIFGIPQLGSLASSLEGTGFLLENPRETDPDTAWDLDSAPGFEDSAPASSTTDEASPWDTSEQNPGRSSDWQPDDRGRSTGDSSPARTTDSTGRNDPRWDRLIQQLSEFGIKDHRLQPGHNSQGFHFACFLRTSTETIVRFEAEGEDPMTALERTVRQVERWHQQPR